jgi:uridylate kinase
MPSAFQPETVHRAIVKISGEFLGGSGGWGLDDSVIASIADDIIEVRRMGIALGLVLGGGNFFRGVTGSQRGIDRVTADHVGMLATIQNSLILGDYLRQKNVEFEIFSALQVDRVAKFYAPLRAERSLEEGRICFFAGGTGNPFFTTDSAGVLRAIELKADMFLKGTKVDGVYTADPMKDPDAEFIRSVTYDDALNRRLNVMDMTAFSLARDYKMPIKVFNITKKGMLKRAILEKDVGSIIHS